MILVRKKMHLQLFHLPDALFFSEIQADIKDLMAADWTAGLDHHWIDQIERHRRVIRMIGPGGSMGFLTFFWKTPTVSQEESEAMQSQFEILDNMLHWALQTEAVYSRIFESRFEVLRSHKGGRTPMEREATLGEDTAAVLEFLEKVPGDFQSKVKVLFYDCGVLRSCLSAALCTTLMIASCRCYFCVVQHLYYRATATSLSSKFHGRITWSFTSLRTVNGHGTFQT